MKMDIKIVALTLLASLAFLGCERPPALADGEQGWHFQGRDCLACHNIDLGEDKHLLFAGTLYKDQNVTDQDNIENTCGGEFVVNFLNASLEPVFSSQAYEDSNSKGYDAKGNIFVLNRENPNLSADRYYVQIKNKATDKVLAVSNYTHKFNLEAYDINNAKNYENRVSCNSCHNNSKGDTAPLFVQINKDLCK